MPYLADFAARAVINVGMVMFSLVLFTIVAFGCLIAIGGTGGFTSSLPPERPAWLGLVLLAGFGVAVQWGLLRLRGFLLSALDRRLIND